MKDLATSLAVGFLLVWGGASAAFGQAAGQVTGTLPGQVTGTVPDGTVPDAEPSAPALEVLVEASPLEEGWIEWLTPRFEAVAAARVPPRAEGDAATTLRVALPDDLRLDEGETVDGVLCGGGLDWAVTCRPAMFEGGLEVLLGLERGTAILGRYTLGGQAVEGVEVSAIPVLHGSRRPLVLPLGLESGDGSNDSVRRTVQTDAAGSFRLPPLAAGSYQLEALFPTGRVHATAPFEVGDPSVAVSGVAAPDVETGETTAPFETPVFDLGTIDVEAGLSLEVTVRSAGGLGSADRPPLAGAVVTLRQAADEVADEARTTAWRQATDAEGVARLDGFVAERPLRVSCSASAHRSWVLDYEIPPTTVLCDLEPLAALAGLVVDAEGAPLPAARVTLRPSAPSASDGLDREARGAVALDSASASLNEARATAAPPEPREISTSEDGSFLSSGLVGGAWELVAAAPGLAAVRRAIELAPGDRVVLDPIVLGGGREIELLVVAAESGQPLRDAVIAAADPPGAVSASTDAEGRARFDLGPGTTLLRVAAEGRATEAIAVDPEAADDGQPVRVSLGRGGWIRAVVRERGVPCVDCEVWIEPALRLVTDSEGVAVSPPLEPAIYTVVADEVERRGRELASRARADERRAVVRAGETTTVVLGTGSTSRRMRVEPTPPGRWWLVVRDGDRTRRLWPQPAGGANAGEVLLDLGTASGPTEFWLGWWDAERSAEMLVWQGRVDVRRGELDEPLVLALGTGQVRGVVESDDAPRAGLPVTLLHTASGARRVAAQTGPDGSFALLFVPADAYQIVFGERPFQNLVVSSRRTLDLRTIDLPHLEASPVELPALEIPRF